MSYFGKIDEFDLANDDWLVYTERLEQYFIANDIDNKKQVAVLLCVMGGKAYGVLHGLTTPERPANKPFAEIVRIMQDHLSSKRLLITKPIRYQERNKNEEEPITDSVAGLKRLSEHCQVDDGLDNALKAHLSTLEEGQESSQKSCGTHTHPERRTSLPGAGATRPPQPTSPVKLAAQSGDDVNRVELRHRGSAPCSSMPVTSALHSRGLSYNEAIASSCSQTSPPPQSHVHHLPQTRQLTPSRFSRRRQPRGWQRYPRDTSMCGITNEIVQKNLLTETERPIQCAEQIAVSKETEAKEGTVLQTRDMEVSSINKMEATVTSANISYQYGRGSHVPGERIFQNELCRKCNKKGHMERDCQGRASNEETTNTIGRNEADKMDPNNMRDRTDVQEMRTEHLQKTMDTAKMDPDNIRDEINEEEFQEIRSAIEKGDLARAVELINKTLECLETAQLNIAVTGEAGAGKSTFVNVLRGLNDEDEGAAKSGVVETTMEPTAYSHPHYENVKYWDLPGIGTPNFKAEDYLQRVGFAKYDFFIIIASGRFRACNIQLAKAIHDMKKNFYFMRSKIDSDMSAAKKRRPKTYNEERILQEIREDCINSFMKEGIENPRVFLLDLLNYKYDCHLLQETLEKELLKHKREAFLLSLPNISLPVLEKKREALRKQVWRKATLACAVAALPIPGLAFACDVTILVKTMREYQHAFGLDESSLCRLSTLSGKSMTELKSAIKSPQSISDINKEIVIKLLTQGTMGAAMLAEHFLSNIPVFGSLAAGGIAYVTTSRMLGNFLNEACDDAGRVLLKAAETSI